MSLGEIVLLLIVGIIVVGPRNLPTLMRTAGQWVARLRRLTTDLRSQSGIDDILRKEGLDEHLHQLRSLSRMNVVESLIAPAAAASNAYPPPTGKTLERAEPKPEWMPVSPLREREYPLVGCDSYGALPDDVMSYRMMAALAKPREEPAPETGAEVASDTTHEVVAEGARETSKDADAEAAGDAAPAPAEGANEVAIKPDPASTEQPKATETVAT